MGDGVVTPMSTILRAVTGVTILNAVSYKTIVRWPAMKPLLANQDGQQ